MHQNKKICVSKSTSLISLVVFVGLLIIFLNYRFLQTKPITNSKAKEVSFQTLTPLPSPTAMPNLTSDPKKIVEYWVAAELARVGKTAISSTTDYDGWVDLYTKIGLASNKQYQLLGELSTTETIDSACSFILREPYFFSPLTTIFMQSFKEGNSTQMANLGRKPLRLSFYKNLLNGEIDAYLSSWNIPDRGTVYNKVWVVKKIPYAAFVRGFSSVIKENGYPLTSSTIIPTILPLFRSQVCKDGTMDTWKIWSKGVISTTQISDVYRDPSLPGPSYFGTIPQPKDESIQGRLDVKIDIFNDVFKVFGTTLASLPVVVKEFKNTIPNLPEVSIGPYIYKDWYGRMHVTYYIDGGVDPNDKNSRIGNYAKMRQIMSGYEAKYPSNYISGPYKRTLNSIGEDKCKVLYTEDVCKYPESNVFTHVTDSKSFMNYYINSCTSDVFSPYANYYSTTTNCPQLDKVSIGLLETTYYVDWESKAVGLFMLHLKPLIKSTPTDSDMRMIISVGALQKID